MEGASGRYTATMTMLGSVSMVQESVINYGFSGMQDSDVACQLIMYMYSIILLLVICRACLGRA